MLQLNNIEVAYKSVVQVLHGVSLEVTGNEIVALLGANGAGKTTLLKAISGLLKTEEGKVTRGTIYFDDVRIDKLDPEEIARMGISQVMEGRRVLGHLSVEENLLVGGASRKRQVAVRRDLEMVYEYFPRLREISHRVSGYCSGGEQQMVVIGRALMAYPKVLLLDEPSLGLAPAMVQEIYTVIPRIRLERKTSILLIEQNASAALEIADRGSVMENGRIVLSDSAEKLRNNEDVQEFYMGLSEIGKKKSYHEVKHYKRRKRWLA